MFDVDILYGWLTLGLSKLPNGPGWLLTFTFEIQLFTFLLDPGILGVRSMVPDVIHSLHTILFAEWYHDVTLADDDRNSIPPDDVNRAILCNVAMSPGGQNLI